MHSLKFLAFALPALAFAAPNARAPTTAITSPVSAHQRRSPAAQAPAIMFSWTSDGTVIFATASEFGNPGETSLASETNPVTFSWTSNGVVIFATASGFGPTTTTSPVVTVSSFSPVATVAPAPAPTTVSLSSLATPPAPTTTDVSTAGDSISMPVDSESQTSNASSLATSSALPSSSASSPANGPVGCPEIGPDLIGEFTLTFDDLGEDNNAQTPLFNPYHALYFSNGFSYGPAPNGTISPLSPPNVAYFQPNNSGIDICSPDAAGNLPGEFTSGPDPSNSELWFNTYSVWMAWDSPIDQWCSIDFSLFAWDNETNVVREVADGGFSAPPCPGGNYGLWPIDQAFASNGLTGVQVQATVNGNLVPFFMDNLELGWFDNSCEAGLTRSQVH